jgi:proteic killer suppression protein
MEISFEKDYLRKLFYDGDSGDKQHRFQPEIVKRYVKVVNILDSVDKPADLYRYRSLHYEKLVGDKTGLESVRVNDKYRLEIKTSADGIITICSIIELSNHYKK